MEVFVIGKQLIACCYPDQVVGELDPSKSAVPASTSKVDVALVPINVLLYRLRRKVDDVDSAVTLAFLATPDYG